MNIPSCIELPYIGLYGACDESSSSGMFINDLEGMSFNLTASLANEEKLRGETLFRSKEKLAIQTVIRDFLTLVQKDFTFLDIIYENTIKGNWSDYTAVNKVGLIIKRCSDPFVGVEMREIAVFPEFDMKVTVVHLENEKEIKTENVTLIGGQVNYIPIKVKTTAQEYQIYIDFCGHRIKRLTSCSCCLNGHCNCNNCADVYPIYAETDEFTQGGYFYMGFSILCRCSFDNLICNYQEKLTMAILYQLGIKLLYELINTDRVNPFITKQKEEARELLKIWEGVPTETQPLDRSSEYYKSLIYAVEFARNYIKTVSTICKECKGTHIQEVKF